MILIVGINATCMATPKCDSFENESYVKWLMYRLTFATVTVIDRTDKNFFTFEYVYDKSCFTEQDKNTYCLILREAAKSASCIVIHDDQNVLVMRTTTYTTKFIRGN